MWLNTNMESRDSSMVKSTRLVIRKSRVWVPTGTLGEFASPGSTFCADSVSVSVPWLWNEVTLWTGAKQESKDWLILCYPKSALHGTKTKSLRAISVDFAPLHRLQWTWHSGSHIPSLKVDVVCTMFSWVLVCSYWAIQVGLLTPLTFAQYRLSPLDAFTSGAYFLHNGRQWQWILHCQL